MSPEKGQDDFTDGISEELPNLLAREPDFRVAGRSSSFAFKGANDDLRFIGQQLNVGSILEDSVSKDGDQIRVTAQLVSVDDGFHLWSDIYDRRLESIFAVQDDIAGQVVAALNATFMGDRDGTAEPVPVSRSRPKDNAEAYARYVRGRHLSNTRTNAWVRGPCTDHVWTAGEP